MMALLVISCSKQDDLTSESTPTAALSGKEPISFSMSDDAQSMTRAGFCGGETFIAMRILSESKGSEPSLCTATSAKAAVGTTGDAGYSNVTFEGSNQRYWDDAHGRNSQLTVYAVAIPNLASDAKGLTTKLAIGGSETWGTVPPDHKIQWEVSTTQTKDAGTYNTVPVSAGTIDKEDLVYSNNISASGTNGIYRWSESANRYLPDPTGAEAAHENGRMTFLQFDPDPSHITPPIGFLGKFDKGHLVFNHALSRITVTLTLDSEFGSHVPNIKLNNMNTCGTLNLTNGGWDITTQHDIDFTETKNGSTYVAQVLPGYTLTDGSSTAVIELAINKNIYYITQDMLYDALKTALSPSGTSITMQSGKNYKFAFNVQMRKIELITATLVDWENVTADEIHPSNSYINVSVKTGEGTQVTGAPTFDIYRAPGTTYTGEATAAGYNAYADYNWEKGYDKSTNLSEKTASSGIYTTEWFWPDNNTFYHFRTISPSGEAIEGNDATTYISVTGGSLSTAKDYIWGAPFKAGSPTPDVYSFETGYCNNANNADGQLYKAIGSTEDNITLIQHHMTSQVFVDLENDKTVEEANRVVLTDATVQFINIAQNAHLNLGNGRITEYSNFGNVSMTADAHAAASPIPAYDYSYSVLPQQLNNTNGAVGIKITTTDGNVYIIDDIKTIKTGGNNINEWLPGKKYYYKFTLKKTTIIDLKATVLDWETVTADGEEIKIK